MEIICIDGKAECGTVQENGCNPDIVSAYSPDTGIILATEACPEKSDEIKAVPALVDKIDISGKTSSKSAPRYILTLKIRSLGMGKMPKMRKP